MICSYSGLIAAAVFGLAEATDGLDGYIVVPVNGLLLLVS